MSRPNRRPGNVSKKKYKPEKQGQSPLRRFSKPTITAGINRVKTSHRRKHSHHRNRQSVPLACWIIECLALAFSAILLVMRILGESAQRFAGLHFFSNLLPFAIGVTGCIFITAGFLIAWSKLRYRFLHYLSALPATVAICIALISLCLVFQDGYSKVFKQFRGLVGGKQQAARITLEHQVYANYRRHENSHLLTLIQRSQAFQHPIEEAAQAFDLDINVLLGIAAAESSFLPRDSHDGGRGLFQITAVSKPLMDRASQRLAVSKLNVNDPRHNAFIAAATFKQYLKDMNGDLFLGLLAYNIGPRNGGLQFIMQQYGANDFITIQPYLQQLPRDYPIRVLSYALAFRLWQHDGKLPAYEDGNNATYIQEQGIPGLNLMF